MFSLINEPHDNSQHFINGKFVSYSIDIVTICKETFHILHCKFAFRETVIKAILITHISRFYESRRKIELKIYNLAQV
jgi:hypothetical protein